VDGACAYAYSLRICRAGQNHVGIYIYIWYVHRVYGTSGKSPKYTVIHSVCLYIRSRPTLCISNGDGQGHWLHIVHGRVIHKKCRT